MRVACRDWASPLHVLLALALGCGKTASPTAAPSASASSRAAAHVIEAQPSSATAFELVARSSSLHVVWASAERGGSWLHQLELSHSGAPRGPARAIAVPARMLGKVTDLTATSVGERLALAWLEQSANEARAQAALVRDGTAPALLDLGPAALTAESARGNIALAPEADRVRALVLWRGLETPCVGASAGPCTTFTFRRFGEAEAEASRLPLSVPVPCASHSVQLATGSGRFHYGVCTRDGAQPLTTMFTIQYAPEYARAEPLLRGCTPLGTVAVDERAWLVADCKGKRRAVAVPLMDEQVVAEDVDALAVSCTPRRAELRQGKFVLRLQAPRAGLEGILPARFVPTGARSGWTGTTLVSLYRAGARLETRAFGCRDGTLQPL